VIEISTDNGGQISDILCGFLEFLFRQIKNSTHSITSHRMKIGTQEDLETERLELLKCLNNLGNDTPSMAIFLVFTGNFRPDGRLEAVPGYLGEVCIHAC
jgi:hypothetical protein